jgi:hypothetical protein
MFVEKRSVLAYGLQSRIVWNFISALKHTLALVTGKIKNRLLEMCALHVLNNCGIESAVLLHFSPCFAGTCLALGNPRGLNVTSLDMRLFAFFFSADLGQFCAFFALIFLGVCAFKTCSSLVICIPIILYNIFLTISTTKRVNTCWISSPVAERLHAKNMKSCRGFCSQRPCAASCSGLSFF